MNNQIKFKFWNRKTKKFIYTYQSNLFLLLEGFLFTTDKTNGVEPYIEALEFTGLIDINGKEIYDGDLIKGDGYGPYRVFWDNGAWCSCCYSDSEPIRNYKTIKIVSNVFETLKYEGMQ